MYPRLRCRCSQRRVAGVPSSPHDELPQPSQAVLPDDRRRADARRCRRVLRAGLRQRVRERRTPQANAERRVAMAMYDEAHAARARRGPRRSRGTCPSRPRSAATTPRRCRPARPTCSARAASSGSSSCGARTARSSTSAAHRRRSPRASGSSTASRQFGSLEISVITPAAVRAQREAHHRARRPADARGRRGPHLDVAGRRERRPSPRRRRAATRPSTASSTGRSRSSSTGSWARA